MKAFVLDGPGDTEILRLADMPVPQPLDGEVLIRLGAVGLNPVDFKTAARGHADWRYPHVLGLDVAGTIEAIGKNVTSWKPGDRVFGHGDLRKPHGGYAEYAIADARALAAIPGNITATEAAALPAAGFTAYQAFFRKFHLAPGKTILIHGGSGGVGGFAIQFAKSAGLEILTTASPKNAGRVRKLGADHFIDYSMDVAAEIMRITRNRGVDLVLDTVGSDSATAAFACLAFGGQLCCIVAPPDFSAWKPFDKAPSVHELALGGAHMSGDDRAIRDLGAIGGEVIKLVAEGKLDPLVGEVAPFADLPLALGRLKRREIPAGKIVVSVSG